MMGFVTRTVTLLLVVTLAASVALASGFENTGVGTTARGMGGAFRTIANDWTATYYNPAGLAWIPDNQLGLNVAFLHYRNSLTPNYGTTDQFGNRYDYGVLNGYTLNNFHAILNKPAAGLVIKTPYLHETVLGFSIYQPFDYQIGWKLYDARVMLPEYNAARNITPERQYGNNLDVVAFQLTAAREFVPGKLSVGVGLQLLRGDLVYDDVTFQKNPVNELYFRPYDQVPEFTSNDLTGWGFGLTAGFLLKQSPKLNLAGTIRLPFKISLSGSAARDYLMPSNLYLNNVRLPGTPSYLFSSGALVAMSADVKTDLKLPPSFSAGIGSQVTPKLYLALDAEYTLWSQFKGFEFAYSNYSNLPAGGASVSDFFKSDLSRPVKWENAGKVMLGAKYDFSPLFSLLGGGFFDQSASRTTDDLLPQFVDIGTKKGFSLGGVFHIQRWDLSMVSGYTSYPKTTATDAVDLNNDGITDSFPGDYKAATYETIFSFNYRF